MQEKIIKAVKSNSNAVPAAQALGYTVERAQKAITWLKETDEEWQKKAKTRQDGSILDGRLRILADIISVYISVLAEDGGSGHSLLKSYATHNLVKEFINLPIVKKCQKNRHNRSAHESRRYGFFVSPEEILNSPLEAWLKEMPWFLHSVPENKKIQK